MIGIGTVMQAIRVAGFTILFLACVQAHYNLGEGGLHLKISVSKTCFMLFLAPKI